MAGTEALAAAFPFNAAKPTEFGKNARQPATGQTAEPPHPMVSGSTLTESNASEKVGSGNPPAGFNPGNASLDRVRVDSGGQALTTNQGVPIADNQNSLKAGLRGPTLLEDFILRDKITHFDHERIPERIVHARGSGAHGYFECYEAADGAYPRLDLSPKPASVPPFSCASPPSPASAARPTPRATCAASPSSSIPTKATGISSVTTSRYFSSRTP
jgi:catalase